MADGVAAGEGGQRYFPADPWGCAGYQPGFHHFFVNFILFLRERL